MVLELKLRKIGNSVGLVLPKEALARLNAEDGDAIYLTDSTDGGFRVTSTNPKQRQEHHDKYVLWLWSHEFHYTRLGY